MAIESSVNMCKIREFLSILDAKNDSWKLKVRCMFDFLNVNNNHIECTKFLNSIYFPPEKLPRFTPSLFYMDLFTETTPPSSPVDTSMKTLTDFIMEPTLENYKTLSQAVGPFDSILHSAIYDRQYNESETLILKCIEEMYHIKIDLLKKYLMENVKNDSFTPGTDLQLLYYLLNPKACFHKMPVIPSLFMFMSDVQHNILDLWTTPISSPNSEYQFHIKGEQIKIFRLYVDNNEFIKIDNVSSINTYIQPRKPLYSYIVKADFTKTLKFIINDLYCIRINKTDEDKNLLKENFHRRREYSRQFFYPNQLSFYERIHNDNHYWNFKTIFWPYLLCYENTNAYNNCFIWKTSKLISRPKTIKIFIIAITEQLGTSKFGILITLESDPQTIISHIKFMDISNRIATRILFNKKIDEFKNNEKKITFNDPYNLINTTTKLFKKHILAVADILPEISTKRKSQQIQLLIKDIL